MRIVLLVEGKTEKLGVPAFFKRWLDRRVDGVGVKPFVLAGTPNYERDLVRLSRRLLEEPAVSGVLCVLDLYGSQIPFPDDLAPATRYDWAKSWVEEKVSHAAFRQHFAVHETEAWLLSQPDLFPSEVAKQLPKKTPEAVNFKNPPSAVLATAYRRAFKNRSFAKTRGAGLFRKLDPEAAASRCPHLQLLLDDLLDLAQGSR